MLILTRKIGEELNIGSDVTVAVLGIRGNQVKIGISAPESVRILRCELAEENRALGGDLIRVNRRRLPAAKPIAV